MPVKVWRIWGDSCDSGTVTGPAATAPGTWGSGNEGTSSRV